VIVGAALVTLKFVALVAVPDGVESVILPVVAPFGTTAVTLTSVTNVNAAAVPLNRTAFTPVKRAPWMTTVDPTSPPAGLKLVIVGALPVVTMKFVPLWALPSGVITTIGPVEAPLGTSTVIRCPVAFTLKPGAFTPLNATDVVPVKFVPWIATLVPTGPLLGSKLEMVGAEAAAAGHAVIETTSAAITADAATRARARATFDVGCMLTLPGDRPMRRSPLLQDVQEAPGLLPG